MVPQFDITRLHHAQLLVGEWVVGKEYIEMLCVDLAIPIKDNPDVHFYEYETMGIEESRALFERAHQKSVGGKKLFALTFGAITHEAQNALLKLLEEPPLGTHFFFITPSENTLLATVRSRLAIVRLEGDVVAKEVTQQAQAFLASSLATRLTLVVPLVEDRARSLSFLGALERELYATGALEKNATAFHALFYARRHLYDRGGSVKMLLESVAFLLQ